MSAKTQTILPARIKQASIPALYKAIAPSYDVWGKLFETKARQRCLELARIRDGETILEVAVGTGLMFAEILKRNPAGCNEGIDLTEAMLDRAVQRATAIGVKNYRLNQGDAYSLKFADDTFDLVVNNYMFDLLPENDFATVLGEFKRVLKPGGRLALVNMAKSERWHQSIWESIYKKDPTWLGGCRGVALSEFVRAAGFRDVSREFISQKTWPSEVVCGIKPQ